MANERDHQPMIPVEEPAPKRSVPMDEDEIWPTGAVPRDTLDVEGEEPSSPRP